jgi:predicted DsbA family dithiol-disulfide isomerase
VGAVIEVFADVWCPFAHVGLRAVADQRRELGRGDVGLVVRSWPLELVNGAPMDPHKAVHHADDLRAQVAPAMFARVDAANFPGSTLDALALVVRAYRSSVADGERASFGLRDALFEQGRNIGESAVLRAIADELGVALPDDADRQQVLDDWDEGKRRGVVGSPHFFSGDANLFCPALAITRTDAGLSIEQDRAKLVAFLQACFAAADGPGRVR